MIRFACFGAFFVVLALAGPASATGGCGVGCSSTSEGACVRDGWQQGLPVRNARPALSQRSRLAAHITDGVGNPRCAYRVEPTDQHTIFLKPSGKVLGACLGRCWHEAARRSSICRTALSMALEPPIAADPIQQPIVRAVSVKGTNLWMLDQAAESGAAEGGDLSATPTLPTAWLLMRCAADLIHRPVPARVSTKRRLRARS